MRGWQLIVPVLTVVLVALLSLGYLAFDGPAATPSSGPPSPRATLAAVVSPPTQAPTPSPTPTQSPASVPSPTPAPLASPSPSPNPAALPSPLVFAEGLVSTQPRPSDYWYRRVVGSLTASTVGWPNDPRITISDAATGARTVVPGSKVGFPEILKFDGSQFCQLQL